VQTLSAAGLTRGKSVTCYEHVRMDAEVAGGKFVQRQTVCGGKVATAQTWQSRTSFYRAIFAQLPGKATALSD
jgi:protease I